MSFESDIVGDFFARCMAQCEAGFKNEHHWINWKKKHAPRINSLPGTMPKRIWTAHEQATHKVFSKGVAAGGPLK